MQLQVGGLSRRYLVWTPSTRVANPAPILLLLHGWSSSAEKIAASSQLPAVAAARGFIVVVPQGSGDPARWALPGRLDGPDDVAFTEALIDDVARRACGDRTRVSVAGFSNGAAFAALLTCRLPLRAVALVGGAGLGRPCPVAAGLPMVFAHGTADRVVRMTGGPVLGGRLHATRFEQAADGWRTAGARVETLVVPDWGHTWPPGTTEAVLATFDV